MNAALTTFADALEASIDALAAAGVETPRLDAELLLAEAVGIDRAGLIADPDREIEPAAARRFGAMVRRRIAREPVAYILGRRGFRRLELAVDRRALIPRPESELVVEVALELEPRTVLDVGTGSGAIALAIADELPSAAVTATDTSARALELARENAGRLGLADRVRFEPGTVPPRRWDLIVANLPYVADRDRAALAPEIIRYEPAEALFGGEDGLDPIRALLARELDCDAIALEVGEGQAGEVTTAVEAAGFSSTSARRDLAGIERVVVGRR